jgi:hypothetical protein
VANPKLETGMLPEPVFVRGFDPLNAPKWHHPRPFQWIRHVELGRLNEGQWMLVSQVLKGGCKERLRRIVSDRQAIHKWLEAHHPLERWQMRTYTVAGTWCDRELYLRYLGEWTPEEKAADVARLKEECRVRMEKGRIRKAAEAEKAREKARQEQAQAQVKIRARRKPGG